MKCTRSWLPSAIETLCVLFMLAIIVFYTAYQRLQMEVNARARSIQQTATLQRLYHQGAVNGVPHEPLERLLREYTDSHPLNR